MLPLDLHVLGLSLAFILSQDQTLLCIFFLFSELFDVVLLLSSRFFDLELISILLLYHPSNAFFCSFYFDKSFKDRFFFSFLYYHSRF